MKSFFKGKEKTPEIDLTNDSTLKVNEKRTDETRINKQKDKEQDKTILSENKPEKEEHSNITENEDLQKNNEENISEEEIEQLEEKIVENVKNTDSPENVKINKTDMRIDANSDSIYSVMDTTDDYLYIAILNVIYTIITIVVIFAFKFTIPLVIMSIAAMSYAIFMFLLYKKNATKQLRYDGCYLEVTNKFVCSQISDIGEYEYIDISFDDIKNIEQADGKDNIAFYLCLKDDYSKSYVIVDEKATNRKVVAIRFFGYELNDFKTLFHLLCDKLPKEIDKGTDMSNLWKDNDNTKQVIKMLVPTFLYAIPFIISIL